MVRPGGWLRQVSSEAGRTVGVRPRKASVPRGPSSTLGAPSKIPGLSQPTSEGAVEAPSDSLDQERLGWMDVGADDRFGAGCAVRDGLYLHGAVRTARSAALH